ncbi:hypothetical protein P4361_05905 [Fictibacillus sp. B-59209]|uniref:hypothetical protein n=1 Tax=Fictibacillus sp. B-59209 TaxID=3024873 RepID=UPI002E21FBF3|nr:hypothetical protein [Fictibacillus sp. B-59209]
MTTIYAIYIVILILLFGFAFWKLLLPYSKTKKEFVTISEKLSELRDGKLKTSERIMEFHDWINNNSSTRFMKEFVQPSWNDFYNKNKQFNKEGMPFTPDVYDFFLEERLMQTFGKRKLVDTIPGVLLSLGIIGTFMGIAIGVSGLDPSGDSEAIQSGIGTLLAGMRVKFISSIAGILLSVIWQFSDKFAFYSTLTSTFHDLRQDLDITFPTQEQSTVLSQMLINQEKQMEDFQIYMTEQIIPTMVSGLSDAINQSLTPHLEETQSLVKNMVDNSQQNQLEGINSMVDQFVSSLSEITGDHMKDLGAALQTTIEWQQKVHTEMSSLVQSMQDSAKEQSLMVEKTTGLTGQINSYTEKITDHHTVMENMITQLNETTDKNGKLQIDISELLDKMTNERKTFHEFFDQHINQLQESVGSLTYQTGQQLKLNDELNSNLEQFKSLSQSQKMLSQTLAAQAELSTETNKETTVLIQKINEVSGVQANIQNELNLVFESVIAERANVGNALNTINQNLIGQLSEMDKRIEHLRQVWETTSNVFTAVNKQLGVSMNQFTDDMHRGLEHTFEQFDEELSKSVSYLSKAVSAIQEGVVDLPDSLDTLKTSVVELNKHARSMAKTI